MPRVTYPPLKAPFFLPLCQQLSPGAGPGETFAFQDSAGPSREQMRSGFVLLSLNPKP